MHLINEVKDQTQCGKSPGGCPGTRFLGEEVEITCAVCLRSLESGRRQRELERAYELRREEAEEERRLWWERYDEYLRRGDWRQKRLLVLMRSGGLCEGCRVLRATQVHHLQYPQGCMPGSVAWCREEKLFHLVAICDGCHADVHAGE